MRQTSDLKWGILLSLVPLLFGLIDSFVLFPPVLVQLVFIVFWFWVGSRFARFAVRKVSSFALGNSIWAISLLAFIWQFMLESGAHRNMAVAAFSQYYMSPFVWIGSRFVMVFTNVISTISVTLVAYLTMLVVFTLGFIFGWRKQK